jgi:hypothetical protein
MEVDLHTVLLVGIGEVRGELCTKPFLGLD